MNRPRQISKRLSNRLKKTGEQLTKTMRFILLNTILLLLTLTNYVPPAFSQQGIDTVYSFTPGTGQNAGQSDEYFPKNIFGIPSRTANSTVPESSPDEICSLGFGGEIIIGFKGHYLYDGPGPDFIIFENVFINPVTKKMFVEPATVSVSQDGINYIPFPYNPETLEGCAGLTPTNGDQNPFDPNLSGGDKFDIAELGLSMITHIKITDISEQIKNNKQHKYYDPIISGFDLDALTGLYLSLITTVELSSKQNQPQVQINDDYLTLINIEGEFSFIDIYDTMGRLMKTDKIYRPKRIDIQSLQNGAYIAVISSQFGTFVKKFIKY